MSTIVREPLVLVTATKCGEMDLECYSLGLPPSSKDSNMHQNLG